MVLLPSSLSNTGVCAFLHRCESMRAAVASTPFSLELQPALFNIGETPNCATESTFWEPAAMSCTVHLVTINGLIHKASWI